MGRAQGLVCPKSEPCGHLWALSALEPGAPPTCEPPPCVKVTPSRGSLHGGVALDVSVVLSGICCFALLLWRLKHNGRVSGLW